MKKILLFINVALFVSLSHAAPATYQDAIEKVKQNYRANRLPQARLSAEEAVTAARTPDEKAKALGLLGQIYTDEKNRSKADEIWNQIILLKGVSSDEQTMARYALAASYLDQRRFEETRNLLNQVISSPTVSPGIAFNARMAVAGSYHNEDKLDLARTEFGKVANDTKLPDTLCGLAQREIGESYFKEEKWELARAAFETALGLGEFSVVEKAASQLGIIQTYEKQFGQNAHWMKWPVSIFLYSKTRKSRLKPENTRKPGLIMRRC